MAKAKAPVEKRQSLADLWDDTDPSEATSRLPVGEHEVRINKMELKEDKKKGTAVFVEYECIDGEHEGLTIRQMYKLTDAAGGKAQGMVFLSRDLALMGHEDVKGSKLKKKLAEITEEQPLVTINVKDNGQYRNAYLQGSTEDASGAGKDKDENEAGASEIEVGSEVKWDDDGDEKTGEVISINKKKETAKVKDDDDEEHTVDLDDLELADAEEEEEIEVGDTVKGDNDDGEEVEGEVTKIKGDTLFVKDEDDKTHKMNKSDAEKVEASAAGGSETELEVGDKVKGDNDEGVEIEGEITKINEKKGTATVEDDEGDDHTCELSDLEKVEEEEALDVGDTVKWKDKKGKHKGEITKINEKKGIATVEDEEGDEHKVSVDDLEKVD